MCDRSTEFLFYDLQTQVENIKKEIAETAVSSEADSPSELGTRSGSSLSAASAPQLLLKTGDFFVTTHSNLNIDVVFHMALEKKNSAHSLPLAPGSLSQIFVFRCGYYVENALWPAEYLVSCSAV